MIEFCIFNATVYVFSCEFAIIKTTVSYWRQSKLQLRHTFRLSSLPSGLDNRAVQNPVVSPVVSPLMELSLVLQFFPAEVVIFPVTQRFPVMKTRRKTFHTI